MLSSERTFLASQMQTIDKYIVGDHVQPLSLEERNLVDLELMIMEQVADWELDVGKVEAESSKSIPFFNSLFQSRKD
jgi:hypothetical protein